MMGSAPSDGFVFYLLIIQPLFEFMITNFAFCNILTVVNSRGVSDLHVLVKSRTCIQKRSTFKSLFTITVRIQVHFLSRCDTFSQRNNQMRGHPAVTH